MKARTIHGDKPRAGVPLTKTFHDHLVTIMKSDATNPEVQNRYDEALASGRLGPDISFSGNEANPLFHNTGSGFAEIGTTLGLSRTEDSRGFVLLDLNEDGAQDVVIHNFFRNPLVALLNRAAGKDHNWVRIRLRGTKSNRFGIGARVEVNGQVRELHCGTGYLSGNAPELHFGLGKSDVKKLKITWPSGQAHEIKDVGVNAIYTFGEDGSREIRTLQQETIDIPAAEPPKPEVEVRTLLKGLAKLNGEQAPLEGPAIVVFFSTTCHACVADLKRMGALEEKAKALGVKLAWVTLNSNLAKVEEEFRVNGAPSMPLHPGRALPGWATPTVYLVRGDQVEKFTGRHAVDAAFDAASR